MNRDSWTQLNVSQCHVLGVWQINAVDSTRTRGLYQITHARRQPIWSLWNLINCTETQRASILNSFTFCRASRFCPKTWNPIMYNWTNPNYPQNHWGSYSTSINSSLNSVAAACSAYSWLPEGTVSPLPSTTTSFRTGSTLQWTKSPVDASTYCKSQHHTCNISIYRHLDGVAK